MTDKNSTHAESVALTDRELQSLRNLGNESESAADEIERLRASEKSAWNAAVTRDEEIERLRATLRIVTMLLKHLGGMLPGTMEVVQTVVEAAESALEAS